MKVSNDVVVDGVPCIRIGGKNLVYIEPAAKYRRCAEQTIYNDICQGLLKAYQLGPKKAVDKAELDALILGKPSAA